MRAQGNLSLVAVVLSALLFWIDAARFLPALWLLLLGHNLFSLGGLAFPPMRFAGLLYQAGGLAALVPGARPLWAMAAATALGNFWIGWGIVRERARAGGQADEARVPQAGEEPENGVS
jgi:O-antigen ligase